MNTKYLLYEDNIYANDSDAYVVEGVVIHQTGSTYRIQTEYGRVTCKAAPGWRKAGPASGGDRGPERSRKKSPALRQSASKRGKVKDEAERHPAAVGDRVRCQVHPNGDGVILEWLPRSSQLGRRAAGTSGASAAEQVIAANLDLVIAVMAATQPAPKWSLLDRYLVEAEAADLTAVVCLTKSDLASAEALAEMTADLEDYRRIGYTVILTSAATGMGLDTLRTHLQGRTTALVGKSGVGKTSLLNALQPDLGLRVAAVSAATHKGRHTTSHRELFALKGGGAVMDAPGMREFGLWNIEPQDLSLYFPEMRPLTGKCRFGLDCRHDEEPGCAMRRAVMAGTISPRRYQSYLRLREEVSDGPRV